MNRMGIRISGFLLTFQMPRFNGGMNRGDSELAL